jgi:hypothetical protein
MNTGEQRMTLSASDLYIVVCYISYSGISGDTDNLYTSKEEAEKVAEADTNQSNTMFAKLRYSVMTLDEYIYEVKTESYQAGRADARVE